MRRALATIALSVTALAVPSTTAWAASAQRALSATKKKITVATRSFTGAARERGPLGRGSGHGAWYGRRQRRSAARKTVKRQLVSIKIPVYPDHTGRSVHISQQALPLPDSGSASGSERPTSTWSRARPTRVRASSARCRTRSRGRRSGETGAGPRDESARRASHRAHHGHADHRRRSRRRRSSDYDLERGLRMASSGRRDSSAPSRPDSEISRLNRDLLVDPRGVPGCPRGARSAARSFESETDGALRCPGRVARR